MGFQRALHESWTVQAIDGDAGTPAALPATVPATVPGCVHTDLLAAGHIPDPYLDDNEDGLAWIGRTAWRYETVFDWSPTGHERTDLVCEGLDTVALIELNGSRVGETANMHRSYRFDVGNFLREGRNRLRITFSSPYEYTDRLREELGERPGSYVEPYQFIRKMACNFGWDWGPRLVTSGIWRPIGLHAWSGARIAGVRPLVTLEDGAARVDVHVRVEKAGAAEVTAAIKGVSGRAVIPEGQSEAVITLEVPDPQLWWPRGYGEQALYELEVSAGEDVWRREIGLRDVRLRTEGGAFTLAVNGVDLFVRGVNWIPDDCFPTRVDRDRYAARLAQACEAGVNLVRIWGGGLYESEDFYDLCDRLGLMVWQDFPFACAAYPEEDPIGAEVEAEAREQVARLSAHPSLVLWCGNNENIEGYADWGWQESLQGRSWGGGFYLETLPRIVAELDPTRPYWPGSPYSGSMDLPPNDPAHGTMHIWDVWNRRDYTVYRDYRPRMAAEYGFQGPAAYATIRRAISDEPLLPDSRGLLHHQKAIDGNAKLAAGLEPHFPMPETFDDWHYLTQVNQARAIQLGVEHFRALWPHCAGSVVWQLNDCWPVTSWSAVDGDGRKKPLFHALRRAYADRLLTVQPRDGGLVLVAVNDTGRPWRASARAVRHGFDGAVLATQDLTLVVPPRTAATLPLAPSVAEPGDPLAELLVAEIVGIASAIAAAAENSLGRLAAPADVAATAGGPGEAVVWADGPHDAAAEPPVGRALWFFAPDKDLRLPEPRYDTVTEPALGGLRLTIIARTLLRDLAVFPDRLDPDAQVDDQLVTLLPGERAEFLIRTAGLDERALVGSPVLRCVNDVAVR
ncbi:glycoside hydrolase family 2 protein [Nonomuraea turkmeniaca]|uniref:beta-mannosidase n=1 Tax=Nonomuraea turkmeniaca TaxID=103838 RepID=A0A5S4FN92_9ACTN|nr:glycoside hydrolase family 2 protein [Nonomuraea turkmeniaca]TMR22163.1 glycoside hydrolase family 2 protein [Nonomuraea turkmeniaca]